MNQSPLQWPVGWARKKHKARASAFSHKRTLTAAMKELYAELSRQGASNVIFSSNLKLKIDNSFYGSQSQPEDRGVAVYFDLPSQANRVLACDTYTRIEDNVWAIVLTISALRAVERYGVGQTSQQFTGYAALPAAGQTGKLLWWQVLKLAASIQSMEAGTAKDLIRAAHREMLRNHPDIGGNNDAMADINAARDEGLRFIDSRDTEGVKHG